MPAASHSAEIGTQSRSPRIKKALVQIIQRPRLARLLLLFAVAASVELNTAAAAPLTRITFVTDWKAQAEHGGFYEALALGLYRKRGLDVRIVEGGPSVNVPQMLAGG